MLPTSRAPRASAVIGLVALFLASSAATAQAPLRATVRAALEYGGERVGEFTYSDGSTPDVIAGTGLLLTAGGILDVMHMGQHVIDARLNAGLKYRTIPPASNQDATWLRFPVEGMLFWRSPARFSLGAGATVHLHNVFQASGAALNDRVDFANAPGAIVQAEYTFGDVAADLRYTAMKYRVDGSTSRVDASNLGIGMTYLFGGRRGS